LGRNVCPGFIYERVYTLTLSEQNGNAVGADTIRENRVHLK